MPEIDSLDHILTSDLIRKEGEKSIAMREEFQYLMGEMANLYQNVLLWKESDMQEDFNGFLKQKELLQVERQKWELNMQQQREQIPLQHKKLFDNSRKNKKESLFGGSNGFESVILNASVPYEPNAVPFMKIENPTASLVNMNKNFLYESSDIVLANIKM